MSSAHGREASLTVREILGEANRPMDISQTHSRPLCSCHSAPMYKASSRKSGWRCAVQARQTDASWKRANYERHLEINRKSYANQRDEVFAHYGNKCACCSIVERAFLSIDHIENDGAEHRKMAGRNVYSWLIRNGYPDGFQLLCMNCNMGRYRNGGICPHNG